MAKHVTEVEVRGTDKSGPALSAMDKLMAKAKALRREERASGEGILKQALRSPRAGLDLAMDFAGGGVAAGGVLAAAYGMASFGKQLKSLNDEFAKGVMTAGEFKSRLLEAIPVFGSIASGIVDFIREIDGSANEDRRRMKRIEEQKAWGDKRMETRKELDKFRNDTAAIENRNKLLGLTGDALSRAEAKQQIEKEVDDLVKWRDEAMKKAVGGDSNLIQQEYNRRYAALNAQARGRSITYGNSVEDRRREIGLQMAGEGAAAQSSLRAQALRALGMDKEADLEQARAARDRAKEAAAKEFESVWTSGADDRVVEAARMRQKALEQQADKQFQLSSIMSGMGKGGDLALALGASGGISRFLTGARESQRDRITRISEDQLAETKAMRQAIEKLLGEKMVLAEITPGNN